MNNGELWWVLDWNDREWLAAPCEMRILRRFAEQPANLKSRKPSRLIYLYTIGWSKSDILADLRIDERTVAKYFQRWIDHGINALTGCQCEPSLAEYIADLGASQAALP